MAPLVPPRFITARLSGRTAEWLRVMKRYHDGGVGPYLAERPPGSRLLVLAPHPDDEVLGCGGTLVKCVRAGARVDIVFLTRGDRGHPGTDPDEALVAVRRAEAREAARILNIDRLHFWELPDASVVPEPGSVQTLRELLLELDPDTVFCPSPFERHPDHVGAFEIFQQAAGTRDLDCWLYEVWSPLVTNYGIDITETWEIKKAALLQYRSQLANVDYLEKGLGLNAFRSLSYPPARFAEAFLRLGAGELDRLCFPP